MKRRKALRLFMGSNQLLNHLAAFFGTVEACLGTNLAMVHMGMFLAFFPTGVANVCAHRTQFVGKFASAGHKLNSHIADAGTIVIQFDAPGQHFYILFL
jgi:hypothetical protein